MKPKETLLKTCKLSSCCNTFEPSNGRLYCSDRCKARGKVRSPASKARRRVRAKAYKKEVRNTLISDLSERYGFVCWYCGIELTSELHVDHIIPSSKGGSDDLSNLALTCKFCNLAKNSENLSDFLEWLHRPKELLYERR